MSKKVEQFVEAFVEPTNYAEVEMREFLEMKFCANDFCDSEATHLVIHPISKGGEHRFLFLCTTCATAYEWGQGSPEAEIRRLKDDDDIAQDFLLNKSIEEDPLNTLFMNDNEGKENVLQQ